MFEMRWVWHNLEHGAPPTGAICVDTGGRLYQKLQYRTMQAVSDNSESVIYPIVWQIWTPWTDVSHSGIMHPTEKE